MSLVLDLRIKSSILSETTPNVEITKNSKGNCFEVKTWSDSIDKDSFEILSPGHQWYSVREITCLII